jgi:hypothetical protein
MDKQSVKLELFVSTKFFVFRGSLLTTASQHKIDYAVQRTADILCSHSLDQKSPSYLIYYRTPKGLLHGHSSAPLDSSHVS